MGLKPRPIRAKRNPAKKAKSPASVRRQWTPDEWVRIYIAAKDRESLTQNATKAQLRHLASVLVLAQEHAETEIARLKAKAQEDAEQCQKMVGDLNKLIAETRASHENELMKQNFKASEVIWDVAKSIEILATMDPKKMTVKRLQHMFLEHANELLKTVGSF